MSSLKWKFASERNQIARNSYVYFCLSFIEWGTLKKMHIHMIGFDFNAY
jgi:hypothetical protein